MSKTIKLDDYLLSGTNEGKTYREMMERLTFIGVETQAYGDWYYWKDAEGNTYEDYVRRD